MSSFCFARLGFFFPILQQLHNQRQHFNHSALLSLTAAWLQYILHVHVRVSDCQCVCMYKPAHFKKQHPWLTTVRCMQVSTSKPHDAETAELLVHSVTLLLHGRLCVFVRVCLCGHCYRFLPLFILCCTTNSPFLLFSSSVPNNLPYLCVWMYVIQCVLRYECFHHTCTHTYMPCVFNVKRLQCFWCLWWWLLNALVLWGLIGVWELTKIYVISQLILNSFFFFLSGGDGQDQVDALLILNQSRYLCS